VSLVTHTRHGVFQLSIESIHFIRSDAERGAFRQHYGMRCSSIFIKHDAAARFSIFATTKWQRLALVLYRFSLVCKIGASDCDLAKIHNSGLAWVNTCWNVVNLCRRTCTTILRRIRAWPSSIQSLSFGLVCADLQGAEPRPTKSAIDMDETGTAT
jgi:hypothetical protein